jgi:hypothetical protein
MEQRSTDRLQPDINSGEPGEALSKVLSDALGLMLSAELKEQGTAVYQVPVGDAQAGKCQIESVDAAIYRHHRIIGEQRHPVSLNPWGIRNHELKSLVGIEHLIHGPLTNFNLILQADRLGIASRECACHRAQVDGHESVGGRRAQGEAKQPDLSSPRTQLEHTCRPWGLPEQFGCPDRLRDRPLPRPQYATVERNRQVAEHHGGLNRHVHRIPHCAPGKPCPNVADQAATGERLHEWPGSVPVDASGA